MTATLTPLISAELADLKAKAKIIPVIKSATVLRLIDMIERRDAWQPIETAPKDGGALLLYQEGQIAVGYWRRDSKVGPVWCTFDSTALYRASHWQPLPAPPSEALATTEPPK